MKKYNASITFELKENHPYYEDHKGEMMTFNDIYYNSLGYSPDYMISYIKHDLSLVAGGGYRTDTIKNVSFKIN